MCLFFLLSVSEHPDEFETRVDSFGQNKCLTPGRPSPALHAGNRYAFEGNAQWYVTAKPQLDGYVRVQTYPALRAEKRQVAPMGMTQNSASPTFLARRAASSSWIG